MNEKLLVRKRNSAGDCGGAVIPGVNLVFIVGGAGGGGAAAGAVVYLKNFRQ